MDDDMQADFNQNYCVVCNEKEVIYNLLGNNKQYRHNQIILI